MDCWIYGIGGFMVDLWDWWIYGGLMLDWWIYAGVADHCPRVCKTLNEISK